MADPVDLIEAVRAVVWNGMAQDDPTPAETDQTARAVLDMLTRPALRELLVRWLGDTLGLDVVVRALVDAYGPESITQSMVEVGVLVPTRATLADSEAGEPRPLYAIDSTGDGGDDG